mmetsp:Transcript_4323/g.4891  ORF Transcript_4323/g.4891 Transcript_4323/m.4891 type:complete len:87 (-) Transcript_4323:2424-2684(-)
MAIYWLPSVVVRLTDKKFYGRETQNFLFNEKKSNNYSKSPDAIKLHCVAVFILPASIAPCAASSYRLADLTLSPLFAINFARSAFS